MVIRAKNKQNKGYSKAFTIFSILVVSLAIFYVIQPSLTGFSIYDPKPVDDLAIELIEDSFDEGDVVDADIDLKLKGPININTKIRAEIGDSVSEMNIEDVLNLSDYDYEVTEGSFSVINSSNAKSIIFNNPGTQSFYFQLPDSADVQSIDADAFGLEFQSSFPTNVKIDVNNDGDYEWFYLGDLLNYSSEFTLPAGLSESSENVAIITGEKAYYCELINVPFGKDFKLYAKYGLADEQNTNGNIRALLLSASGAGDSITGYGGTNSCDLPEPTSTDLNYQNCEINLDVPIDGNNLFCVYNTNASNNLANVEFYRIGRDGNRNNGYKCGQIIGGQTTCTKQNYDFFVKIQKGNYDGKLNGLISFVDGFTEFSFEDAVMDYLDECYPDEDDNCIVQIDITSNSKGILHIENLALKYTDGGTLLEESSFYEVTSTPSVISDIDNYDLTSINNLTITFPLEIMELIAPSVNTNKNFTLEVSVVNGPSDDARLLVLNTGEGPSGNVSLGGNVTVSQILNYYKGILNSILSDYSDLMEVTGYKSKIQGALTKLNSFASNISSANLLREINKTVNDLPRSILSSQHKSDIIITSSEDISDDMLFSGQNKNEVYFYQRKLRINLDADLMQIDLFNDDMKQGTLIKKTITGAVSDSNVFEIIPKSITSMDKIKFVVQPEVVKQDPLVLKWKYTDLQGELVYFVNANLVSSANKIKTVVVPRQVPEETPAVQTACGDGVCSVLNVDGEIIPLEDKYTCPEDCKKEYPVGLLLTLIVIAILLVFYINFYKGKYNFYELLGKLKLDKFTLKKKLFASSSDENNLREFVSNALAKGVDRDKIYNTLLSKGWTREQIDYIFGKK